MWYVWSNITLKVDKLQRSRSSCFKFMNILPCFTAWCQSWSLFPWIPHPRLGWGSNFVKTCFGDWGEERVRIFSLGNYLCRGSTQIIAGWEISIGASDTSNSSISPCKVIVQPTHEQSAEINTLQWQLTSSKGQELIDMVAQWHLKWQEQINWRHKEKLAHLQKLP